MIGWLQGHIIERVQPGRLVVNVQGVGYDVETSLPTFFQLEGVESQVALHIHTIVREDAFLLYGFLHQQERAFFRTLIKVNGVGPKMAIGILSSISPDAFALCIEQKNTASLTKLPGIGKKTAERLLVEMKDNMQQFYSAERTTTAMPSLTHYAQEEAIKALEALGYRNQEASKLIHRIDDGNKTCEQLIRDALKFLS